MLGCVLVVGGCLLFVDWCVLFVGCSLLCVVVVVFVLGVVDCLLFAG